MYRIFIDCGIFSSIIPIFFLIRTYKKAHREMWWALFLISFLWVSAGLLNWTLSKFYINNLLVFQLFGFLSLIAYGNLFYRLIKNTYFRIVLVSVIFVLEVLLFVYTWINSLWFQPNMLNLMIAAVIPFVLSIYFFYSLMTTSAEGKLVNDPFYWINSAILIRFGMAFFTLIFIDRIVSNPELMLYLWPIVSVSNIIYNILLSRGIWQMKRV